MKHTSTVLAVGAACLIAPSLASAHNASCNPQTGQYVATNQSLSPVFDFQPEGYEVVWSDGFKVWRSYDARCVTPAPTPVPPEDTPPTPAPPAVFVPPTTPPPPLTCAELLVKYPGAGAVRRELWGCPANPTKKPPLKVTKWRLVTAVACKTVGERGYSLVRTRVTWTRDGKVVRVKTSSATRVRGPVCRPPAVTG